MQLIGSASVVMIYSLLTPTVATVQTVEYLVSSHENSRQKESPTHVRLPFEVKEPVKVYLECPHCRGTVKLCIDPDTTDAAPMPTDVDPASQL